MRSETLFRPETDANAVSEDFKSALRELLILQDIVYGSLQIKDLEAFWPMLSEKLKACFSCERTTFFWKDSLGTLKSLYAEGLPEPIVLKEGEGIAGEAVAGKKTVSTNEPRKNPNFHGDVGSGFQTRSVIACPLLHGDEVVGVLELLNKEGGFTRRDREALTRMAPQIQIVVEKLLGDAQRESIHVSLLNAEKFAAIGRTMTGLSHEIQNPLAGILANAQLLARALPEKGEEREMLDDIVASVKHCDKIVTSLLVYGRKDAGEREEHRLEEIVEGSLDLFGKRLELSNVEVEKDFDAGMPPLRCNRGEIQQVVVNLLANARQAMPDGGRLDLTIRNLSIFRFLPEFAIKEEFGPDAELMERALLSPSNGKRGPLRLAVLEVTDTGPGIERDVFPRLFEPFFTTKAPGEGIGLGLSLGREILHQHGGFLIARNNRRGPGAQFVLVLPIEERHDGV